MTLPFLLQGILIGFSIAAPVGPIGILCIRRTLSYGLLMGVLSGFGAATADAIYGSIAAFGLTGISNLLINYQDLLRLIGGIFLVFLGLRIYFSKPATKKYNSIETSNMNAYLSTFFLTLTNPLTILSFMGIFAGLGIATSGNNDIKNAISIVIGVFSGSMLWWLGLSSVTTLIRCKIALQGLIWVNRISGIIIIVFGLIAFGSLII
jgi:threonine/homoserine/homoserine lactone efflux protein